MTKCKDPQVLHHTLDVKNESMRVSDMQRAKMIFLKKFFKVIYFFLIPKILFFYLGNTELFS